MDIYNSRKNKDGDSDISHNFRCSKDDTLKIYISKKLYLMVKKELTSNQEKSEGWPLGNTYFTEGGPKR